MPEQTPPRASFRLVVMGTSWGGLHALRLLLAAFDSAFPLPIAIVQHRSKDSDDTLCALLQERSRLPVAEGEDKEPLRPGHVYIAPADYHMLITDGAIALSVDEPVGYSRPSIDVLFESAADAYPGGVIGVVLTGANQDGTAGLRRVKAQGGFALVQDPDTAESRIMPEAAISGVVVDRVLPLAEIATFLMELCAPSPPSERFAGRGRG